MMSLLLRCVHAPRLYRIHQHDQTPGKLYVPNTLENIGDTVFKWLKFCWSFSYWTSPVLLVILYRRGAFTPEGMVTSINYGTGLGIVLVVAVCLRAIGRFSNVEYTSFLKVLREAQKDFNRDNKRLLSQYDFDFRGWPVEFRWDQGSRGDGSKPKVVVPRTVKARGIADKIKALPCYLLSYLAIHSFGRRMVYPGTTALIQTLMAPMLMQGRAKLVEEKKGVRSKLLAEGGLHIDTMFVDHRNSGPHGNTLVICCEGNSGFYEVGCMVTPLETGHSVLGWNHPGFWGSTGVPFPRQEQNAIDVVMQYAIHKLGFQPYDIVLFAWSIGGYPATWAAMNYPDVRHVVLDATFDDIVPLAAARMPQSWRTLVTLTVKKYMHLNCVEQLLRYPGPVLLIRRSKDEMITTVDPTVVASNRGNELAVQLLQYRYPKIVAEDTMPFLREWLATDTPGQASIWSRRQVDAAYCESIFRSYVEEHSNSFPMQIGADLTAEVRIQLTLFLVSKHLNDFDATHCQPLPGSHFRTPWTVTP